MPGKITTSVRAVACCSRIRFARCSSLAHPLSACKRFKAASTLSDNDCYSVRAFIEKKTRECKCKLRTVIWRSDWTETMTALLLLLLGDITWSSELVRAASNFSTSKVARLSISRLLLCSWICRSSRRERSNSDSKLRRTLSRASFSAFVISIGRYSWIRLLNRLSNAFYRNK